MSNRELVLVSDFNIEPLSRLMSASADFSGMTVKAEPFGQVYQSLMSAGAQSWATFLWTLPQRTIPSFAAAFNLEEVDRDVVFGEVDRFCDAILSAAANQYLFVATWTLPGNYRGYGNLDWRPGLGVKHLLAQMNVRMAERLAKASNIYVLDADEWSNGVADAAPARIWYAAKVPYSQRVYENVASDIRHAIEAIDGTSRRLIVLDLDNTLWGGVVGETGWQGIRLGGHDYIGEAYKDFQVELKALSNRGIQLAVVSKNDEAVALAAIDQHPEMMLHRDDLAGWRINWGDKAANLAALVEELNLGLASVVFIDDNPAERDRVARALPRVLVPEWPADAVDYVGALRALNCFQTATVSREDRGRKAMYVAERGRREAMHNVGSADEWLKSIGTKLSVAKLGQANLARVGQLLNKTNQLNLSTRRLSAYEIEQWASEPGRSLLALSVADNFGDMGLVGIVSVETADKAASLVDFVLSCRAMGRKVEEAMLHLALEEAKRLGADTLDIRFLPTERNSPTLQVLEGARLKEIDEHRFQLNAADGYAWPDTITLAEANA